MLRAYTTSYAILLAAASTYHMLKPTPLYCHTLSHTMHQVPTAMERLTEVLPESNGDALQGLSVLLKRLKVGRSLKGLGMKEEGIDEATDIAMSNPYANPRETKREPLRELIRRCFTGKEAQADL